MCIPNLKRILLICLFLIPFALEVEAESWKELKGDHFVVSYGRNTKFAKDTLDAAEEYYNKIANDLGYDRHSRFWSWENRVRIYIYPDKDAYLQHVRSIQGAEWSVGYADYKEKKIVSYSQGQGFLNDILPHEITHLMFRDYVGVRNIPIWIDEGIAQWEEKGRPKEVKKQITRLLRNHNPISMDRMMCLNIGEVENEFIVDFYYLQAVSMIDFLINRFGTDKFIYFCRQLRDGKDIEDALQFAYPTAIRSLDELEKEWLNYLHVN